MNNCEYSLITIITVTHNCQDLIAKTIESVCSQTYPNKEHIIVDGGSTDETVGIIKKYRKQIKQFITEKDNGIYDAMNKGIRLASLKSQYITFLNAGDVYMNENVIDEMLVGAKSAQANLYGNISVENRILNSPGSMNAWTMSTNMVCHQACFFQTKTHRKYCYDTQYKIAADYKLLLELIRAGEPFEKVTLTIADMDISGISHTQRALLLAEKKQIRKQYPRVYFYARIKNIFKQFRRKVGYK